MAKTGAFSKAAQELFVTEPAVFIQVRSLERFIGFKLIDKFGKDLQATEVGRVLFAYAEKIFGLVEEADKAVKELQALKSGDLRIGITKVLSHYLMPLAVPSFQCLYPKIKMFLSEGNSEELVRGVVNRQFELAMVARIPYTEQINALPFSKERIVFVVSPENRVAGRKEITLEELNAQPIICRDEGSATRFAMNAAFEKQGLCPSTIIESGSTEFIKDMVRQDKGCSFLSSICVSNEIRTGELVTVPLREGDIEIHIDLIHLKGRTLSPAATTFLSFLGEWSDPEDLGRTADKMASQGDPTLATASTEDHGKGRKRLHLVEASVISKAADL